jgi:hypothetical protein
LVSTLTVLYAPIWLADLAPKMCQTGVSHLRHISGHIKKKHTQVSILAGTQNVKNVDMRVDRSLQKKMEKNNKSARTHPAYRQSWDTLMQCGMMYAC